MSRRPLRQALVSLAVIGALAVPAAAQTLRVERAVNVTGVANGFAVENGGGLGARGMWCGAATYARKVLGASDSTRIYVAQGRGSGLGARGPVVFTTDATGLTPRPATILGASINQPGANLSVAHAGGFCIDFRIRSSR